MYIGKTAFNILDPLVSHTQITMIITIITIIIKIIRVLVWAVVCVMDEKLTPARLPTTQGQGHDDDDECDGDGDDGGGGGGSNGEYFVLFFLFVYVMNKSIITSLYYDNTPLKVDVNIFQLKQTHVVYIL